MQAHTMPNEANITPIMSIASMPKILFIFLGVFVLPCEPRKHARNGKHAGKIERVRKEVG